MCIDMLYCLLSTINCGEITAVGFFTNGRWFILTLFPFPSAATGLMYPTHAIVSVIKRICWWMHLTLYELKRVMTDPLRLSQGTKKVRQQMCFVHMGGGCRWNWIHGHPCLIPEGFYVWQVWKCIQYQVTTCPAYLKKTITCLCSRIDLGCMCEKQKIYRNWLKVRLTRLGNMCV